jgi:tetratricopeptide (TPR) repeat protein
MRRPRFSNVPPHQTSISSATAQLHGKFQQAVTLHQQGQLGRAQRIYEEILNVQHQHFGAMHMLGVIAAQTNQRERAVELIGKSILLNPQNAMAQNNYGNALHHVNRREEAVAHYEKAIALNRDYADAYYNRGIALFDLKRYEAALESYDRAIALNGHSAEAHYNRGLALTRLHRYEAALASYERAIAIKPDYAEAFCNRGGVFRELMKLDAALTCYNQAIALRPDYATAYANRAYALLSLGDFEAGWVDHEWRWKSEDGVKPISSFPEPLWLGKESIAGRTILLHTEQGLGDTIQFCRYVKLVSDLGARVILQVQSPLMQLLSGLEGLSQLVLRGNPLPDFDYQCPLMSLPLACKTTLSNVPAKIPYLKTSVEKVLYWKEKLGEKKKKLRVGLVWSGGFRPNQPELWSLNQRRNIALATLAPLRHPDIEFFSLQKGQPAESELAELRTGNWGGPPLVDFADQLQDFSDTAALIEHLDLVISVDTSTAHLAGALGKPVWILNRFDTCWRWLLDRTDSPWYPTARLYRQRAAGDWDGVVQRVQSDLGQLVT